MSTQIKNSFLLLIAALIWGTAFVAQSFGAEHIGAFSFTFLRNVIGVIVLLPIAIFSKEKSESPKTLCIAGVLCGIALGIASCLQQYGLKFTTAGKAGFLTALYMIMVPIFGLFLKKKCSGKIWIAVILATIGVYLLCIKEDFTINIGDFYEFLCAIAFVFQIMIISHFSHRVNPYRFACIEFFVAGLVALIPMLIFENLSFTQISASWLPILYTGIMSSGIAYTLQIIGQRDLNPTIASIIMSLEASIAAISAWIIQNQAMTSKELWGCILMFTAIILSQLPDKKPGIYN